MPRYIDADALKQRIMNNWYTASEISDDIDAEPTADVVEVKHGKWDTFFSDSYKVREIGVECSFCGYRTQERTNYCPNCGADMRGGTDG